MLFGLLIAAATATAASAAAAEALLLVEVDSGKVLHAENATSPWYPASVTKLMTLYVTLRAVKEGRITLDTPFKVSANALAQSPTKMGFKVGTVVTVDNAIKMMMVKSANDMAVLLAEGVAGSVDAFAGEMNANARRLGMVQSSFVNPNGLPADRTGRVGPRSRDPGARADPRVPRIRRLLAPSGHPVRPARDPQLQRLLDLYPGADGMKTGFICASGFNLVATATRNGRRFIAVVLGAPSASVRTYKAAKLLEEGFNSGTGLNWLTPALGTVDQLVPLAVAPVNLREQTCGPHRKRPAAEDEEVTVSNNGEDGSSPLAFMLQSLRSPNPKASQLLGQQVSALPPVDVFVGTVKPTSAAAVAAQESQIDAPKGKPKKGKLAKKPKAKADANASADAAPDSAAPAAVPTVKTAAKPKPKKTAAAPTEGSAATGTVPKSSAGAPAKPRPAKTAAPNTAAAPAKPAPAQQ